MKLYRVLVPLVFGFWVAVAPVAHADPGEPSSVRAAYLALRDRGCDVTTIGSPIVARALRNVPYALRGKIFTSAELTHLFTHDGDWYKATSAGADVDAADRPCVRALDAQEKLLRKRVKLKPSIEQAIIRDGDAVLDMSRLVLSDFTRFRQTEQTRDGSRVWTIHFEAGSGAALVTVECQLPDVDARAKPVRWQKLTCHVLAAG
jgi:hypothetical protein